MNRKRKSVLAFLLLTVILAALCAAPAFAAGEPGDGNVEAGAVSEAAAEDSTADSTGDKALAAAVAVGLAAAGGAVGMGLAIAKSTEGISRQPEAEGRIRTAMMLGLVFIETAIIYALIVAILIIFVL